MTLEEMKAERKAMELAHQKRMKELKEIQALMGTDPAEALRRVREGRYLPKKSPTK